ncbi:MAG TPA: LuxR C-terminal-related transcriptional regulator [Streptosporangiaceae bacterium]|nr:LuxR C-terminal-related transcriptional regulator [Streptosporangiaceae bacterium]
MGAARSAGGLRGELTEFVGRRAELARVRDALEGARLVTLTGPGGIGKTRLALQVAAGAGRAFRDGVWLTELSGLRDPGLLVGEVARSLGLSDRSARWAVASLADYLENRQLLLVLDGCEHLADACAVMADALLRGCPGLRIIATSRHVLGVAGEVTTAVPPMTVPAEGDPAGPEELLGYEAVRLFAGRGAAVLPGFAVDVGNGAAVAGVCRTLDGIPLAVELAAVRLRSLSPEQILARLDSRFQLLSGGSPAGQPQHRTLQAALEWSYELLTDGEQAMWRRVSVFAGSFDLDAAEAVCAVGRVAAGQIADLIDALVAKSILLREGQGTARYRLLDTIREFGLTKLRGRGNERALRRRHRAWYAALAARQEAFGPRRAEWIAALDADHDNLRGALELCVAEPGQAAAGAEMACDLWRYWETHGHLTEGRRILTALLDQLDRTSPARLRVLWTAGFLAQFQGDIPAARRLLEACLSEARQVGDVSAEAWASSFLGWDVYYDGDADQGHALARTALRLQREAGHHMGEVMALMQIGYIHVCAGEAEQAACWFTRCADLCRGSGNVWYHAYSQWGLAVVALLRGDYEGASRLGHAALRAIRCMDDAMGVVLCLDALAWAAAARREAIRAATLAAAAEKAWAAIPATPAAPLRAHHDAALEAARAVLPGTEYRAAFAKGSAMDPAEAIAFALGESARPRPEAGRPGAGPGQLTRRERDVATLVAQGMSNSQIAAVLVISVRTVETHVQHIMDKLGCSTRAQIAAWSAARSR